jgi:hypothetical protein
LAMAVEIFAPVWACDVSFGGVGGGGLEPPMISFS